MEMRELIRAQQLESGVATLYVTHDQEEAMSLADRVVVMEGGRIRQDGTAATVYDQPADLFVAHFIGSPGMNFIEGEVQGGHFAAAGFEWKLEREMRPGKTTLGVRPEWVRCETGGTLRAEVVRDEYLGSCRNIHLQAECGRLVMRAEAEVAFAPGTRLELGFASSRVCFFDPESGVKL
jgi:multiple sugar transport system ATP-binding protein